VAKAAKKKPQGMSRAHKDALAKGREEGRKVRAYLEALDSERQRGRSRDPETIRRKIAETRERIDAEPNPARRVEHIQRRLDLEDELEEQAGQVDLDELERDFVEVIANYAERKGLTYPALREAGVPASVLKEAGIRRTHRAA
jgi:hypothetical protein